MPWMKLNMLSFISFLQSLFIDLKLMFESNGLAWVSNALKVNIPTALFYSFLGIYFSCVTTPLERGAILKLGFYMLAYKFFMI